MLTEDAVAIYTLGSFSEMWSVWMMGLLIAITVAVHLSDRLRVPVRRVTIVVLLIALVFVVVSSIDTLRWLSLWRGRIRPSLDSLRSAGGIAQFCRDMQCLAQTQLGLVLSLLIPLYVGLQSLCIPGTIVLNAIVGALIGTLYGAPLCTALGTIGACSCYMLSYMVGSGLIEAADRRLMNGRGLRMVRLQVSSHRSELFVYLLFMRLTPILPNWLINLASPFAEVPLSVFAAATLVGILPQTYLSVRFGSLVQYGQDDGSVSSIISPWDTLLLAVVGTSLLGVVHLKKRFGLSVKGASEVPIA